MICYTQSYHSLSYQDHEGSQQQQQQHQPHGSALLLPAIPGHAMYGTSPSDMDIRPLSQFELPGLRSHSSRQNRGRKLYLFYLFL